jgi:hypothetical protein
VNPDFVLTPGTVDFEVDADAARRSLQIVEMDFAEDDCAVQEGAVLFAGRRRVLRFDTVVRNMGELDCVIGMPSNPVPPMQAESFEFHDCHGHYHLEGYASYELRHLDGTIAAIGHKQSFCITDSIAVVPGTPRRGFDCAFQGLTAGWADVYDRSVPGQWVDVSGVPGGSYVLVLSINPEGVIQELDDVRSNVASVDVTLPAPDSAVAFLDDHADAPENATAMPSPAGFEAGVQVAGDLDWFQFTAHAGGTYTVRTVLLTLADSRLRVFAEDGTTLLVENDDAGPGDPSSSVSVFTDVTRVLKVEVTGPGSATGRYRLLIE